MSESFEVWESLQSAFDAHARTCNEGCTSKQCVRMGNSGVFESFERGTNKKCSFGDKLLDLLINAKGLKYTPEELAKALRITLGGES